MNKLNRTDLLSLEQYSEQRDAFRTRVLAHKKNRRVAIGEHVVLLFEDRLTIQYQVQEMLRIERIFEANAITEELDAYNPLIPDGQNLKATMQIEFEDPAERQRALESLLGLEDRTWIRVGDRTPLYAIADEDMDRENSTKTAAVHFLRFELDAAMISALKQGDGLSFGCDHPAYRHETGPLDPLIRDALAADLA